MLKIQDSIRKTAVQLGELVQIAYFRVNQSDNYEKITLCFSTYNDGWNRDYGNGHYNNFNVYFC